MLVFNHSGLLVPDSKITSSIAVLEDEFVIKLPSPKRLDLFKSYIRYCEEFKKTCGLERLHQWVNGSFVTKKPNPGDIDIVTFLDHNLVQRLGHSLDNFKYPNSEAIYNVDAFFVEIYPAGHPKRHYYTSDWAYWYDRFTKTRRIRGNRLAKGFLEMVV